MNASIAIVGGGVFGTTAAIELAARGHDVHLIERRDDLLLGASGINQYRLHRGYHYPRSLATAIECRDSEITFTERFRDAVVRSDEHYYAIAARHSLTSAADYLRFCDRVGLEYTPVELELIRPGSVAATIKVRESLFDPNALRRLLWTELRRTGVRVHLGVSATRRMLDDYDLSVMATYSDLNLLGGDQTTEYQYEVCEKPVVRLPPEYAGRSVVIMDGPFMCVDPFPGTDFHVLGNVVHAIHSRNVGHYPQIPDHVRNLLDSGVVLPPKTTRIDRFIASASEFFRGFERAEHVGSMFTVRAVLPAVEDTDARPTIIRQIDDRTLSIFSGKIDTCVRAARDIGDLVDMRCSAPRSAQAS